MSLPHRIAEFVTDHSVLVVLVLLALTLVFGVGATTVDDDPSLEQFESDSPELEAADYASENFAVDGENETTVQVIVRGDGGSNDTNRSVENVLSQPSLVDGLRFQEVLREDDSIEPTLADDDPTFGLENAVATTIVAEEEAEAIEARGDEIENRSETLETRTTALEDALDELGELEREYAELNASFAAGEIDEESYEGEAASIESSIESVEDDATDGLDDEQTETFLDAADDRRALEAQLVELEIQFAAGEIDEATFEEEADGVEAQFDEVYATGTSGVFEEEFDELDEESEALEEDSDELEETGVDPSLSEQVEALEGADDETFEDALEDVLDDGDDAIISLLPADYDPGETSADARMLFVTQSTDEDVGTDFGGQEGAAIDAQLEMQSLAGSWSGVNGEGATTDEAATATDDDQEPVAATDEEYVVFGVGVISDEIDRSMEDSLAIVGPLALCLVVVALTVAYRDPLDIVLGVAGILIVLVWTFGFMGLTGIAFNQMFVAVPVLLIGLSIDYAIHVFMRHRERRGWSGAVEADADSDHGGTVDTTGERGTDPGRRGPGDGPTPPDQPDGSTVPDQPDEPTAPDESSADALSRPASPTVSGSMAIALAGVGVALVWVTATTAIGFLANLVSPIQPVREFGLVSAWGILSALVVFGALVPAAKVKLDALLEDVGLDRRRRAFGTGGGVLGRALSVGAVAARRAPLFVVLLVVVLTIGGVYAGTQVDTTFEEEDFLAEEPPEWTESLPEPFAPGEYRASADLEYVNEHFQRQDTQAEVVVRGDVTADDTLERIEGAESATDEAETVYTLANGEPDVESPLTVIESVAAENESVNETVEAADTTGDGVPDEDLESVYDEVLDAEPDAASAIYRSDGGEYEALRMTVSIRGDAPFDRATDEMREVATVLDDEGDGSSWDADDEASEAAENETAARGGDESVSTDRDGLTAIATGGPVVNHVVEEDLFETVFQSLAVTLVSVFVFLTVAYRITGSSATLGLVTLAPVAVAVSWILGSMYLLEIPFNVLTGMITSLTIGLGIAYCIHVSSRYVLELKRQGSVWAAIETTVTGTGGALLGSAATTIGGFGVLGLAVLPVLQQFGIITALTILYAFLASVIVLPTLLVLWTRYLGPDVPFEAGSRTGTATSAASDGGTVPPDDDSAGVTDSEEGTGHHE